MLPKQSTSSEMESDNLSNGHTSKSLQTKTFCDTESSLENSRQEIVENGTASSSSHDSNDGIAQSSECPVAENGITKISQIDSSSGIMKKKIVNSSFPEAEQYDERDSDQDEIDNIVKSRYHYQNGDTKDCNGIASSSSSSSSKYHDDESRRIDGLERAKLVLTSHKNLIRKKRFFENSHENPDEESPRYSQSFDCPGKFSTFGKNAIRKKESLRNNRQCNSVDYRSDYDQETDNTRSRNALTLSLEDPHSSTESVEGDGSNCTFYELAGRCESISGKNDDTDVLMPSSSCNFSQNESMPGNSRSDVASLSLKKPFKLPSLVNLFEAAKAQQRIELAENASALAEASSSNDHDLDESTGLDIEPGSSYSSDGSNSDTESQRITKPHQNAASKKRSRVVNGLGAQERVEYYQLWRSTGGPSVPESLYDTLYPNPPPLPPRTAHRLLQRSNALTNALPELPRRHQQKHSAPCRPEDCFGFEIVDVDETAALKARTAITKSIALLSSPRPHRPLMRPESALINQGECPPTPTHRPRPLPICPSSNASLTSEEPLPPCESPLAFPHSYAGLNFRETAAILVLAREPTRASLA